MKATQSKEAIYVILDLLDKYEENINVDASSVNSSLGQCMSMMSVENSNKENYELAWSQPSPSDYNALKLITDGLETEANVEELRDCLIHVQGKTDDFPVEFFMMPPYMINHILKLLSKTPYLIEECVDFCSLFLESLQLRVNMMKLPICQSSKGSDPVSNTRNQLKVSVVVNKILLTVLDIIDERFTDDNFSIVNLIKLMVKLITSFPSSSQIDHKWILLKVMFILRSYRKRMFCSVNAANIRLSYFLVLSVIHRILPSVEGCDDSELNELKTALFDHALHQQFPEIIQQLEGAIHLDPDLEDLLHIKHCFISIVGILQAKDIMPEDELILIGNQALQTVSIVESLTLTQLFFKAIRGKLTFFPRNSDLKNASIQIIHRLLSCGSPRIRLHFYNQVNACVKESFALLMERDSIQISLLKHGIFGMYKIYYF